MTMIDPTLEAAFAGTANAKIPGPKYSPRLGLGEHTVVLKTFKVKKTDKKGLMYEAELFVEASTDPNVVGQSRNSPWFPGADTYGIQEGYARQFLESCAQCIGDTSPLPQFAAILAGPGQAGRGLRLKVVVKEQISRTKGPTYGQVKRDPKTNQPYTEMVWYPIAQSLDDIHSVRLVLDSNPMHAIQPDVAPAPVTAVAAPAPAPVVAAPTVAAAPLPVAASGGASSLLGMLGKK